MKTIAVDNLALLFRILARQICLISLVRLNLKKNKQTKMSKICILSKYATLQDRILLYSCETKLLQKFSSFRESCLIG